MSEQQPLMDYTVTIELTQRNFDKGVYRATTEIVLPTNMGSQGLSLGANGSTPEKAIEHLRSLVVRATKAMYDATSF